MWSLLALLPLISPAAAAHRRWESIFAMPGVNATYDYVVIGGGTGGLAIASRLAENASVAVIEAGGIYEIDNGNRSVVPLYGLTQIPFIDTSPNFPPSPWMDWVLIAEAGADAADRQIHYAQGKTLGGSTSFNTMAYHRAPKGAYQRWADGVDDDSYTFDNLLPYFRKSCTLTGPNQSKRKATNTTINYDSNMCGDSGGPVKVSWNNWVDPALTWLAAAVQTLSLPISPEGFSSGKITGHSAWIPMTIDPKDATRSSAETSYGREAFRHNMMIYPRTQATKILFNANKKATGVEVSTMGVPYTISAANEVILSAGVFHSPHLLMVSGIGPAATLQAHNIPIINDLPGVGQNLWDPISIGSIYVVNVAGGATIAADPANWPSILQEYLQDAAGPYSSAAGFLAFEKIPSSLRSGLSNKTLTDLDSFPADWPELEYIAGTFPMSDGSTIASISCTIQKPISRGSIDIMSSNISHPPAISLNWLSSPTDQEVVVTAVKRLRQVWSSVPASMIKVGDEIAPGGNVQTDAEILEYVRGAANPLWHASGTCKMGKAGNVNAVVDSHARVFGVTGLRVVDTSAFPFALPAHPQGTLYAFAEKIADDIKNGD
ncbi:hypothetical protein AJ80_05476 [Polytolypa hystricis UAMH7299]|uniref:Ig-like domain-containing protein n=1 Tax=Polytolypa hystricis (strain UAMH7299) TaxID=1447883 RepID=A0A2B7Y439_POLH7|nr:hypothetical protein AJ80_05476 [Polytolypa hystricis UAMH7299]